MIFSRVSPTKGKCVLLAALSMSMILALVLGVAAFVTPSQAALSPDRTAPAFVYGVGATVDLAEKGHELRRREVVLDKELLKADGAELPEGVMAFGLFEDLALFGVLERTSTPVAGIQNFSGRILDKEHGYFTISVDADGGVLAQLEVLEEGIAYVIAGNPDADSYYVSEVPLAALRAQPAQPPSPAPAEKKASGEVVYEDAYGPASIDVLVAYTDDAEFWALQNRSGILNVIAQAVERANLTFVNSEVDLGLRLVHAAPVAYVESGEALTDLHQVTFSTDFDPDGIELDPSLDPVHAWRDQYGADLVVLMTAGDAGAAWLMQDPAGDGRYGFSVVPVQTADVDLVRQIGYNLGCHHSRNQQENPAPEEGGLYTFSTGARWVGTDGRGYASIMTWPENDIQVFVFSNPEVTFSGAPTGGYDSPYAPSDNARSLRAAMHRVAAYRPERVEDEHGADGRGEKESEEDALLKQAVADETAEADGDADKQDDEGRKIYVLGGTFQYRGRDPWEMGTILGDVYSLDAPGANSWRRETVNAGWPVAGRMGHASLAFNTGQNRREMWVIGGATGAAPRDRNDVYFSENGSSWSPRNTSAAFDPRRGHTALAYNSRMWILGGYQAGPTPKNFDDVWSSTDGRLWTKQTNAETGAEWQARAFHTSVVFNNRMYVLGGGARNEDGDVERLGDMWHSTDGRYWVQDSAGERWAPRFGHTSVVFNNRLWVLGGRIGDDIDRKDAYANDVWSSADGITWIQETANAPWEPRSDHASVVYDGRIWVLGGWFRDNGAETDLNDVWTSVDGVNWESSGQAAWLRRHGHAAIVFPSDLGSDPDEGEAEGEEAEGEEAEGENGDEDPAASFDAQILVRDQHALLPLHDWVPLFRFTMAYGEDEFAPRLLRRLVFQLLDDDRGDDLDYALVTDLHVSDLLELAILADSCPDDDDEADEPRYGNLDSRDRVLFSWDPRGYDRGNLITATPVEGNDLLYDITLDLADPYYQIGASMTTDDCEGSAYIVAVRTSATWRSQLSLGVEVLFAEMIDPRTGQIPRDEDGAPIDSYSPDFFEGDTLEAEAFYSASFGVYDPSGVEPTIVEEGSIPTANVWYHTPYFHMPLAEFSRPRWNKPQQLMSIVAGEFMGIRQLIPLDGWTSVIGINLHSARSFSSDPYDDGYPLAKLREVNVIMTDVGADPFGPPGNGGFNPRDALKPMWNDLGSFLDDERESAGAHNGIWVWQDTNGNALFDAPTPQINGGVTLNGDEPLAPLVLNYDWEYIPEPPGGGDPWWKIRLLFGATSDYPQAYVDPIPNNVWPQRKRYSEVSYDYHVVARFDSGHKDVSLNPASNTGATMGAEFRAFIEPRRFDVTRDSWTGGIYVTSQIPALELGWPVGSWQNDPRWFDEPWWPERTLNPAAAKPFKVGVDVHDLVTTYRSQAETYRTFFNNPEYWLFNLTPALTTIQLGHVPVNNPFMTWLGAWVDPIGLGMSRFQNGHYPEIYGLLLNKTIVETTILADIFGETFRLRTPPWGFNQFAFEVRPFYADYVDAPPFGPRSPAYPMPPMPPALPSIETWPPNLEPGNYPRLSDWDTQDAQARLLTQKIEASSKHTPMLGLNLTGSVDPIVNDEGNSLSLAEINVAFWGPDFTPDILMSLDPDRNQNQSLASGVLLWEKSPEGDISTVLPFTFLNAEELDNYSDTPLPLIHDIVPVTGLRWSGGPEFVDLSGDGNPDDLNGDGVVDNRDKAWVLTLQPSTQWELPLGDEVGSPEGGIDLYISVKTSDAISRFQKFRAVIPATLPDRAEGRRRAGIQFYPAVNTSAHAYQKQFGDEGPVQEYYGHDMIEANMPMRIVDMTQRWTNIHIGGAAVPVLGLDIATNRADGTRARGTAGAGSDKAFKVTGAKWSPGAFIGDFLVDERYESYEIVGNTMDTLALLSGTPRSGPWRIVQEPTFLEEVTVELYQQGDVANFNPLTDLLPLDIDQRVSGVAIYRDNDNHPDNRNGVFDPDIDIPLTLDAPPRFVGRSGEDIKVRFVFSTPGTRDFPQPIAEQPRNRQWVHDTFGGSIGDPESGPDFFIVLRASQNMREGDNLRAGIVSWGPNTPTEPDPHIWAGLPGEERHDYLKFREFPWAERGVGFVTFFKEPQTQYFLNWPQGVQRPDTSGVSWIRSHSSQKRRSGVITAKTRPIGPRSIQITGVSQSRLPVQTLPGAGFSFAIHGSNFGTAPMVALSGYHVTVDAATNTSIQVTIESRDDVVPYEPVTLVVRNPHTGEEMSRSDLFTLVSDIGINGPKIHQVSPGRGRKDDFPVVIRGVNFFDVGQLEVRFGNTIMPILDVTPDGTGITVGFPLGGLPQPGPLDVHVASNGLNSGQDVKINAFEYLNPESREKVRYFGCQPAGNDAGSSGAIGDLLLLIALAALLMIVRHRDVVHQ